MSAKLTLAEAVEILDGRLFGPNAVPFDQQREAWAVIKASLPTNPDFAACINRCITYGNDLPPSIQAKKLQIWLANLAGWLPADDATGEPK